MSAPKISVLMPVYNAGSFIKDSIQSLLNQTEKDFEILIVDDGCTDNTISKIGEFKDNRIRLLVNEGNLGAAASMNKAISAASGQFLARMDADDLCVRQRFEVQLNVLNSNPTVDVIGSALKYFGASTHMERFPETHQGCKSRLLFNVCFGHSSIMLRREVFEQPARRYDPALLQYSEDYDLYVRLVDTYTFANLHKPLVRYRTFPPPFKQDAEERRRNNSGAVRMRMLVSLGIQPTPDEMRVHQNASDGMGRLSKNDLEEVGDWFNRIVDVNARTLYIDREVLSVELSNQFFMLAYHNPTVPLRFDDKRWSFLKGMKVSPYLKARYQVKKVLSGQVK
jgi:glycosyltransferase involved in cell wall biosynthesis